MAGYQKPETNKPGTGSSCSTSKDIKGPAPTGYVDDRLGVWACSVLIQAPTLVQPKDTTRAITALSMSEIKYFVAWP